MKFASALRTLIDGPIALEARTCERILSVLLPRGDFCVEAAHTVVSAVANRGRGTSPTYQIVNDVAIIGICGIIVPQESEDNDDWGLISCERIRSDLRAALSDDGVRQIVLSISSPGGSVIGLDETAAAICAARSVKPVTAFSLGMTCSAAYYLASQANEFCVSKDSINGSIGCYSAMYDYSKMYEKAGIKVDVIRCGEMKGAGTPGTPITDAMREELQRIIQIYYDQFIDAVCRGRNIPRAKALALGDGRVYVGAATIAAGLADKVDTFDGVLARLAANANAKRSNSIPARAQESERQAVANEALFAIRQQNCAIIDAFAKNPSFAIRMILEQKTLEQAHAIFADEARAQVECAPAAAESSPAAESQQNAIRQAPQFCEKVEELISEGTDRGEAVRTVVRQYPHLHRAYVLRANLGREEAIDSHWSFGGAAEYESNRI